MEEDAPLHGTKNKSEDPAAPFPAVTGPGLGNVPDPQLPHASGTREAHELCLATFWPNLGFVDLTLKAFIKINSFQPCVFPKTGFCPSMCQQSPSFSTTVSPPPPVSHNPQRTVRPSERPWVPNLFCAHCMRHVQLRSLLLLQNCFWKRDHR